MLHKAYYLVRPHKALEARVGMLKLSDVEWLLEPQLWSKGEPDRSSWDRDEHLACIKLLFISWLRSEYETQPEYSQLFGEDPLTIEAFDAWWTIERFYFPEPVEEIERQLRPEVVQQLQHTGQPNVDRWLTNLKAQKSGRTPVREEVAGDEDGV